MASTDNLPSERPPSRSWATFGFAHVLQFAVLAWCAAHANFCCDVLLYYIPAGQSIWHDGLLWNDSYSGYRFYLTPLVLGALQTLLGCFYKDQVGVIGHLPAALACLFFLTSSLASMYVFVREGTRRWSMFAVPLLFNPVLVSLAVYPLQESTVVIFGVPLLFLLLSARQRGIVWLCIAGGVATGLIFGARGSLTWIALPIAVYLAQKSKPLRPRPITLVKPTACAAVACLIFVAPQSYIAWRHAGTLNPFTHTQVAEQQVAFGIDMLEYSTIFDEKGFRPFPVASPYVELSAEQKTLHFYAAHPSQGLFLVLAHVWAGLHYVDSSPYVSRADLQIVTPTLIFSSLAVALALIGWPFLFEDYDLRPLLNFLLLTTLLSCLYTALTATEPRFGLLGFAAVSTIAWIFLLEHPRVALRTAPLVLIYVALCIIINALLLFRTLELWPKIGQLKHVEFQLSRNSVENIVAYV